MSGTAVLLGRPNSEPQRRFFESRKLYTCYGGARGGGKSWAVRTKAVGGALRWPSIRILILRRTYRDLENSLVDPLVRTVPPEVGQYNASRNMVRFANGSSIKFGHLPGAEAADRYVLMGAVHVQEPQQAGDRKGVLLPYCDLYVSGQSVWFSTPEYGDNGNQTAIYCFGLEDGDIWAKGAAKVPGELHDSFSLDEYKGCLRLVTTEWDYERGTQMNHLFVLDKELKVIGQIEDIAPGETVRSVRFCQDIGYFVTFRNVDPLFTVDLSAPSSPEIVGELKVTGFSSYLHPYQEGLLLGIGQEADENSGAAEGYKLSMFDISDPAETAEAHKELLGAGYVPGATDYKAVLADGNRNLIGLCRKNQQELYYEVYTYQPDTGFAQVLSYQLAKADSVDGYVNENLVRGLYAGETFYVVSPAEIAAFDMGQEFERTGGRMLP